MTDRSRLISLIEATANAKVVCVGDVILDHFHYGSVERISPEAPIPVLKLDHEDTMLGGAGNVLRNLAGLGAGVSFLSVVGKDHDGRSVERLLADIGVTDTPIVDENRRTSVKSRFLAGGQQMLRTDRETVCDLSEDQQKELIDAATAAMTDARVLVLSDYKKGVLSKNVIQALIAAARAADVFVVVDPKGADFSAYSGADVITPNRHELLDATGMPTNSDEEVIAAARHLIDTFSFGAVLATRSKDGMTLVEDGDSVRHMKAEAQDVFDVSGAGDTVVATLAGAIAAGGDLGEAAELANIAAGIVVAKVGTAVAYSDDIISSLHHLDITRAEAKVLALRSGVERIDAWRRSGATIGFTNGCFDLLHPGHVSLLEQSKGACARLIVGLNSDASIKRLKGDDRPVQTEAARAAVLASLGSVDMVIIFSEDTPIDLIEAIRPDVLVKGADYTVNTVVGADLVQSYGGRVELFALEPGHSTTATIARLAGETC
ncbi:MAG: D-glycero-beta-D-manno-heptose-7-phosphate kinase [Rhodospirillaceae bacterium]|jgi:D-beta-D-heptose 7-phosphate kinase/D-beta-D-heptose 1-phosphate adenosyltransferase|nr:D-glycero-beta-D-manno-heptose-7-phosphate kinase [Rhodospirillaceae bacterium]MBT4219511.1 D-glycero-beta-D-manno-heptose-7-phosphate kinase [Rhodospirillaceae bacterium]MBT4463496.1 D-glycero-beta-D-manno-heptose-7-phosphate kinase [Rhodospirillaceae bacterium]MBT5014319.1 D-glycero-beta-D-manno-heptose-7-phosphate kinase [Rhodospirillaceae bacterium]MBT5308820.1 D-glycero-beta-D-manno-heptose-7-phosphate kinase [Rhodospirillaceae bacterium]